MLSTRGRRYAALDLAAGYTKNRGHLYDKTKHPTGLVSFSNAENLLMREEVLDYIKTKCIPGLEPDTLTYHDGPFGSKRLRQAMAAFINKRFSPVSAVTIDQVSFVSGVTALNDILSLCMTDGETDGLLLGMPIYGSFYPDMASMSNCKLVYAPFDGKDQFTTAAVEHYERAVEEAGRNGIKVKALILSNPHNPLGRCYPRETLEAILRFCEKQSIHLISDEIYAQSVYGTSSAYAEFISILSVDVEGIIDEKLVHVMYGMSKDFAAAGLRLGCLITRNKELGQAVQSLARFHGASPVTDAIATTILEDEEWHAQFLTKSARALRENHELVAEGLNKAGIPFDCDANVGFFLWIDLSACLHSPTWEAEDELKQALYDHGVEMSAGQAYHDEKPGNFRFLFSLDRDIVEEGLRRVSDFYNTRRTDRS